MILPKGNDTRYMLTTDHCPVLSVISQTSFSLLPCGRQMTSLGTQTEPGTIVIAMLIAPASF